MKYCYSNDGISFRTVADSYTVSDGEVLFSSVPTTAELKTSFPSTAGSIVYTITTNTVSADTVTIQDVTLTAGTDFTAGSTITTTATNIAIALNDNSTFSAYWTATASDATITVTENIAGNQNTPSAATYTGTIVISSGTATTSVYGYINAYKAQELVTLNTTYANKRYPIERALLVAYAQGNTTISDARVTDLNTLQTEYIAEGKVIIDG